MITCTRWFIDLITLEKDSYDSICRAIAGSRFEFQQYHRSGTEVIWLKIIIFVCNCLMFGLLFASCRSYLNRKQSRIDKKLRHLASISDNLDFLAACSLPEVRHTEQGILNTSSEFIQCLPEKLEQERREASSASQSLKNVLWLHCTRSNYAESKLRDSARLYWMSSLRVSFSTLDHYQHLRSRRACISEIA